MTRFFSLCLAAVVAVSLVGCTQPKATTSSKVAPKVEGTKPTGPSNAVDKPAETKTITPDKPAEKPADKPGDKTPPPVVPEKK